MIQPIVEWHPMAISFTSYNKCQKYMMLCGGSPILLKPRVFISKGVAQNKSLTIFTLVPLMTFYPCCFWDS